MCILNPSSVWSHWRACAEDSSALSVDRHRSIARRINRRCLAERTLGDCAESSLHPLPFAGPSSIFRRCHYIREFDMTQQSVRLIPALVLVLAAGAIDAQNPRTQPTPPPRSASADSNRARELATDTTRNRRAANQDSTRATDDTASSGPSLN